MTDGEDDADLCDEDESMVDCQKMELELEEKGDNTKSSSSSNGNIADKANIEFSSFTYSGKQNSRR